MKDRSQANRPKSNLSWLSHPLFVTVVGTGVITAAGACLTDFYQIKQSESQRKFEIFKSNLNESYELIDDLSKLMSKRLFAATQVIWAIKAPGGRKPELVWENYYETVKEWNVSVLYYKSRISRLLGGDSASIFVNEADYSDSSTVHGQFMKTHIKIKVLYETHASKSAQDLSAAIKDSEAIVIESSKRIESFVGACSSAVEYKANQPAQARGT